MRTKMADTMLRKEREDVVDNSAMVKESVKVIGRVRKECITSEGLCSIESKFYLSGADKNFGANFHLNGVGLRVHASQNCDAHVGEFSADFKSLCSSDDVSSRKKRCTDRYDSSESSDSGVAVLSSTDCSTSSGNSDITEPGSPYSIPSSAALHSPASTGSSNSNASVSASSASEESDDSRTGSPASPQRHPTSPPSVLSSEAPTPDPPAPEEEEARPPDPWLPSLWVDGGSSRSVFGSSQKRRFHSTSGAFKSMSAKRPKPCTATSSYHGHFQNILQCFQGKSPVSSGTATRIKEVRQDELSGAAISCGETVSQLTRGQGKITEYFKTQMKPPSASKCVAKNRLVGGRVGGSSGMLPSIISGSVGSKVMDPGLSNKYYAYSNSVESCENSGGVVGAGGVLATVGSGGFIPVQSPERLELCASDIKGHCANGRVRGPDKEAAIAPGEASSVSVVAVVPSPTSAMTTGSSMPAPILSAPKTLRFPVVQRSSGKSGGMLLNGMAPRPTAVCHWSECKQAFDSGTKLMEHLQSKHVNSQVEGSENFVCLWVGCKVYARTSCSRSWLERHVLSHGGNKPFRCIFDGCGQRFSSQIMLERHVNGHFNVNNSSQGSCGNGPGGTSGAKRNLDATPNKAFRRNGKKLRYRRRPWSARMFDYFDTGVMEELQHRLIHVTEKELLGQMTPRGDEVLLTSKVLARRTEQDGKTKVLLRWYPEDIGTQRTRYYIQVQPWMVKMVKIDGWWKST